MSDGLYKQLEQGEFPDATLCYEQLRLPDKGRTIKMLRKQNIPFKNLFQK